MQQIIKDFQRPDQDLLDQVSTQHIGVAGMEIGPRHVMHPDIKPLDPKWRICGPALTVRPEYWDDRLVTELAPKYAKPGDIIVVDAAGHTELAVWGMSMTRAAVTAGAAGVVIDGSTMNANLLTHEQPQIPIFAKGVSAVTKEAQHPGSINVPVICGGVIVHPGDIILADADDVVVIPPGQAEKVLAGCQAHDKQAKSDHKNHIPFHERKDSEKKLRAFPDVEWT